MQAAADEKQVDLVLSLPAKVPVIRGDKDRLHVVLTNLIGNAIKYTPDGGRVHVTCLEDGAKLSLEVKDTGIGIHPDDRDKIFDKFYRAADEQVAKLPGTGLGLAIARETVRAHGGTIELQSEPGVGSTFTILLPIGKLAAIHT
jgi:signal transduction histidine kinase